MNKEKYLIGLTVPEDQSPWRQNEGMAAEQLRAHTSHLRQEAESARGGWWLEAFETSKPSPWHNSSNKPTHFQSFPNSFTNWGPWFKHESLWGSLSFKPPQTRSTHLKIYTNASVGSSFSNLHYWYNLNLNSLITKHTRIANMDSFRIKDNGWCKNKKWAFFPWFCKVHSWSVCTS